MDQVPISVLLLRSDVARRYGARPLLLHKANPNHDRNTGRFTSGDSRSSSQDKLAQIQAQTALDVPESEIGRATDLKSAKAIAREEYRKLQGTTTRTVDGNRVGFGGAGFKETARHAADRRVLEVIPVLPELLKRAVKLYEAPPDGGTDPAGIRAFHYYAAKARFSSGDAVVLAVVREDGNGHFYYDNDATDILALQKESARSSDTAFPIPNQVRASSTEPIKGRLAQWWSNVNYTGATKDSDHAPAKPVLHKALALPRVIHVTASFSHRFLKV